MATSVVMETVALTVLLVPSFVTGAGRVSRTATLTCALIPYLVVWTFLFLCACTLTGLVVPVVAGMRTCSILHMAFTATELFVPRLVAIAFFRLHAHTFARVVVPSLIVRAVHFVEAGART